MAERVRTERLPLFPLPLVLFPGAPMPLHVFEPRYRALLADVRAGDGRFGIVLLDGEPERALPPGRVGCVAALRDVQMLPDGRANILVEGERRFAFEGFADTSHPYHVAIVSAYDDEATVPGDALDAPHADALDVAADRARRAFERVVVAASTIADESPSTDVLPADATLLAFRIASLVDFSRGQCQQILESRSPIDRLRIVESLLRAAIPELESRADLHGRARSNGHGPSKSLGTS